MSLLKIRTRKICSRNIKGMTRLFQILNLKMEMEQSFYHYVRPIHWLVALLDDADTI